MCWFVHQKQRRTFTFDRRPGIRLFLALFLIGVFDLCWWSAPSQWTGVLDDGTLLKNAQVDTKPFQSDLRITQAGDSIKRWVTCQNYSHEFR